MAALLVALVGFTPVAPALVAQPGKSPDLTGAVFGPDGAPATGATVAVFALQSPRAAATATVDRDGRFRLVLPTAARLQLVITHPDATPYRVIVVSGSQSLEAPPITLLPASHFQARFVTPDGEALPGPRLIREFVDGSGARLPDAVIPASPETRADGTTIMGPLPFGRVLLALDAIPFARVRLSDVDVNEAGALFDAGTIVVQPGAVLNVDVVDEAGTVVADHDVTLEDVALPPLLGSRRLRTDGNGRATFDRLGEGRYRVSARTIGRCGPVLLPVGRVVSVPGSGTLLTRLVVGGSAAFRLSSPFGALAGVTAEVAPETGSRPEGLRAPNLPAAAVMRINTDVPCRGTTDADGRMTLRTFPPGPARLRIARPNSSYLRRVAVPGDGREIAVTVPDGFLQVRVVAAHDQRPIGNASITWTGGEAQVEARTVASGDAVLEGVATLSGRLTVAADRYQTVEAHLSETSALPIEVALTLTPETALRIRVVRETGRPVLGAVLTLEPTNPMQVGYVAATDANGMFTLAGAPAGTLRLTTIAEGLDRVTTLLAPDRRGDVVVTLKAP
jgi:hypothetical protein